MPAPPSEAKPNDLLRYWETLKTPEGKQYYFCEATNVTQYEVPSGSVILLPLGWQPLFHAPDREVYFLHEASGRTDWELPPGYVSLPEPEDIVNDLSVYYETLLDGEGVKYYFQDKLNKTQYAVPVAPVPSRTASIQRAKLPVVLPPGWYAAAAENGEVYFVKEAPHPAPQETDWNLPKGSFTAATMKRGGVSGGGGRGEGGGGGGDGPRSGFTVREPSSSSTSSSTTTRRDRALGVARAALKAWLRSKRAGLAPRILHRPRLFRNTQDGKVMLLNPQGEEGVLVKILKDPTFEYLGVLRGKDARAYAIPHTPLDTLATPSAWNATKDASSGKLYYFNMDPSASEKGPLWVLPPGGRVVARVLLENEELSVRTKKMSAAKALVREMKASRRGGGGGDKKSQQQQRQQGKSWDSSSNGSSGSGISDAGESGKSRGSGGGGGGAAATASGAAAAAAASVAVASGGLEPPPIPISGPVEVSTLDGSMFKELYVLLDPPSRLLLFFDSEDTTPGTERGVVDMLSAVVYPSPPPGAPHVANAHCLWLTGDGGHGVFGAGKGGITSPPSALVFNRKSDLEDWFRELQRACHATGMSSAPEPPSRTLLHCQHNAGLFSSLRSPVERWVKVSPEEQTLVIHESAGSVNVARVLKLSADEVKIGFTCEEKGAVKGWGNLRIEVTALSAYDNKYETHYLRARNYQDFIKWVSALAAL